MGDGFDDKEKENTGRVLIEFCVSVIRIKHKQDWLYCARHSLYSLNQLETDIVGLHDVDALFVAPLLHHLRQVFDLRV